MLASGLKFTGAILNLRIYFLKSKPRKKTELITFPHEKADGAGALFSIAQERSWNIQSLIPKTPPPKISNWTYLKNIILFLFVVRRKYKNMWPFKITKCISATSSKASAHFSESETEKLKQIAQNKQVSLNSLLFYCLHQSVAEIFSFDSSSKAWWIPVNMRRELGLNPNDPSLQKNYVSNFTVEVDQSKNLSQTHQLLASSLKQKNIGEHGGGSTWENIYLNS